MGQRLFPWTLSYDRNRHGAGGAGTYAMKGKPWYQAGDVMFIPKTSIEFAWHANVRAALLAASRPANWQSV
ncbi:hypothetical protein KCP71_13930 [Salmonella enterica subsp. enterica]|nr:hypothetical protein KCP71_13930 [Salmonella enterica subsp. enterica]